MTTGKRDELEEKALDELTITDNIFEEFIQHPARFARWGFLYARAVNEVRVAEGKLEILWAELYEQARIEEYLDKENERKAWIVRQEEYKKAQRRLRKAKYDRDSLEAAKKAFDHRLSMLQQIGPVVRKELESLLAVPKGTSAYAEAKGEARKTIKASVADVNTQLAGITKQKREKRSK